MKTKGSRNKNGVSRILTPDGYYEIFEPLHPAAKRNGYVREHRMIAWNAGALRDLRMEVHHINGDKTDNRLENLRVMTKAEHTSVTWRGRKREPWTIDQRIRKSIAMVGNKNYLGIHENPELLK